MSQVGLVAIVTGGAQGIGRACCVGLAKVGTNVVFGDINKSKGEQLEQEWKKEKSSSCGEISFMHWDASKSADCKELVKFAVDKYNRIDILFNNVGIQPPATPIYLLDESTWDNVMNVNLKSYFLMCKEVIPHMMKNGGSIINNASIQGVLSQKCVAPYAASKGGILSLTRALAVEYGHCNIRVNSISPGTIQTDMGANNTNFDYAISNTPLGNLGVPEDIASAVIFLASSRWITGQNIVIDGGITIKGGWSDMHAIKF